MITTWNPENEVLTETQLATLKADVIRQVILSNNNLFCETEICMFGSAGLQQAVENSTKSNKGSANHLG